MGAGLARRRWKSIVEPWRIILLTGCAAFFALLAVDRGPDGVGHQAIMTALNEIDLGHASLQRDVLRARAGLLRNYDPLVEALVRTKEAIEHLEGALANAEVGRNQFSQHIALIRNSLARDEGLAETFKTRNALLQNSLAIFNQSLARLHRNPKPNVHRVFSGSSELGSLMMRFTSDGDTSLGQEIHEQLQRLQTRDAEGISDWHTLIMHGDMIVLTLPAVNQSVSDLQSSGLGAIVDDLRVGYLKEFGDRSERDYLTRVFLGSASALLCLGVSLLVFRLKHRTRLLAQRLSFETSLSRVKDRMAEFGPEDFGTALSTAAGKIAEFFKAQSWRLIVVDLEKAKVHVDLDNSDPYSSPFANLLLEAREAIESAVRPNGARMRQFHRNLRNRDDLSYYSDGLSSGIIVGTQIDDEPALILMLGYAELRPRPLEEEISLHHLALEALAHETRLNRGRQERSALEQRLEHAQRLEAIGTLAGGIAHEFNNILGAIMGYGEMAMQSARPASPVKRYVSEILAAGVRAKQVIDQILTFSRKRDTLSRPFDVSAALSDMLPLLKASLPKGCKLVAKFPERPVIILGHPIDLQQIVFNLCRNAADASGFGGTVSINLKEVEVVKRRTLSHGEVSEGLFIVLTVEDQGCGIPATILPHIFEPFFTTKLERGGTGLGLATVHGRATALGGQIDVHSMVGRGTRFDIYFRRLDDQAGSKVSCGRPTRSLLGSGEVVGVLESDQQMRMRYEETLAALGYEPVGFRCPAEIKTWLAADGAADCVLLDLGTLQLQEGFDELSDALGDTPHILIGGDSALTAVGLHHLRIEGALVKPINSKDLALAVREKIARAQSIS